MSAASIPLEINQQAQSTRSEGDHTPGVKFTFPPPRSCSSEEAPPMPPLAAPLMSPAVSNGSPSVGPPPLELPPPTPPPLRTSSTEPLGGMFYPELNHPCVVYGVKEVLCPESVMDDRRKAARVSMELEDGCVSAETLEWVIKGLKFPRDKRGRTQRLHGLEFVGPRWGSPTYKTGSGVDHLLRGVSQQYTGIRCQHLCSLVFWSRSEIGRICC